MSLFSRLTLAWRLTLGFGLVLALMVGITLTGIQKVNFIDRSLQQVTDVNAVKQRYAINFRGSVHDRAIVMRDVALETDPARHPPLLSEITRLDKFYQDPPSSWRAPSPVTVTRKNSAAGKPSRPSSNAPSPWSSRHWPTWKPAAMTTPAPC